MEKQLIAELYKSATIELNGFNIPRHEYIDLRQELVCQTYVEYKRLLAKNGIEPDLQLLKAFLRNRKKELWGRSFVGKNGGGASRRDIMNQKHLWDGLFEKVELFEDLALTTRKKAEEGMSFNIDIKMFMQKLTDLQRETMEMLLGGFQLNEICKTVKQSYGKVKQIINSVKEAYLKYFGLSLQMAK